MNLARAGLASVARERGSERRFERRLRDASFFVSERESTFHGGYVYTHPGLNVTFLICMESG